MWAYGKAFGSEFDVCPQDALELVGLDGAECYSGWFGVAGFAALTFVAGLVAWRLLGGGGYRARPR